MVEVFKAKVRRRTAADDEGLDPEDVWPEELVWVMEGDWYEAEQWSGGTLSPFATHAEALADALNEVAETRARNERRERLESGSGRG